MSTRVSSIWFSIISVLFLTSLQVHATERITPHFTHITDKQGLSNNTIWGIVQDNKGFMWFGTLDGLCRYDGYAFKTYSHHEDNPTSLSDNVIRCLYKARDGSIWIGTNGGGLNMFDPVSERFTRYTHNSDDPASLSHNQVWAILEDSQGFIWVGTAGGGLNRLNRKTGKFTVFQNTAAADSLSHNDVRSLYEDHKGILWIGTFGGGLNKLDRRTGAFRRYTHTPYNPASLSNNLIWAINEDQTGKLWIGTFGGGLNKFTRKTETFSHYTKQKDHLNSISSNNIITILPSSSGNLWIGTGGGGVCKFDPKTNRFINYPYDSENQNGLSHKNALSIFEDRTGAIWIGTGGNGINRLDPNRKNFNNYLKSQDVRSVYEDKAGIIWAGTNGNGLIKFDRKTGGTNHYTHDANDPTSLPHNIIWAIHEDSNEDLWIGTVGGGLCKFNRKEQCFTRYQHEQGNPSSLSSNHIWAIYEDRDKVLWIGTHGGGLNKFDREAKHFRRYIHAPDQQNSLSHDDVRNIFQDTSGDLWIGTSNGLNRFDQATNTFVRYQYTPVTPGSLSYPVVLNTYQSSNHDLWVGTFGGGLNLLNRSTNHFDYYKKADGLPNNVICGILEDETGHLWISTHKGLSKFNPQEKTFINYDAHDGLQGNSFNKNAFYQTKNKEMILGGTNGITIFHPDAIKNNPHKPPVVFTDFQLSNTPVSIGKQSSLQQSISYTKSLSLSHKDRVLSFEFAALNYLSPQKNRYRFKLENFDDEWNEIDSQRRFATYTNIDPGEYIFKVSGSNNDGVWSNNEASLVLTIRPPWWETLWFKGGTTLLIFIGTFGLYRVRVKSITSQKQKLQVKVSESTEELRQKNINIEERTKELENSNKTLAYEIERRLETEQALLVARANLEEKVKERTRKLTESNISLNKEIDERVKVQQEKEKILIKALAQSKLASLGEIATGIAHEVNQPLSFIRITFEAMLRDLEENQVDHEELQKDSHECLHQISRISAIIDHLRTFGRNDGVHFERVNLEKVLRNSLKLMSQRLRLKNIKLVTEISPELPRVKGDAIKLEQIFINFLQNSLHALKEKQQPEIYIHIYPEGNQVILKFSDNGSGIPTELQDKVFEPFYTTKEIGQGTGLGLAIVYGIVSEHQGTIECESQPGEHTTFHIRFPADDSIDTSFL